MGMYGLVLNSMSEFIGWYFLLSWLACGIFCSHVANEKNRCGVCWFIWGILFGPMALLAAVGLPDKSEPIVDDGISPKTHVLCPECKEPVKNEAKVCKHCAAALVPLSQQSMVK